MNFFFYSEKEGGQLRPQAQTQALRETLDDCGIVDICTRGLISAYLNTLLDTYLRDIWLVSYAFARYMSRFHIT